MSDEIRKAATVIVTRPGPRGPEILVQIRSSRHRFLPGYVVFPGGAVDPGDAQLAGRLFNDPEESGRACALRELHEEVGLSVTAEGVSARGFEAVEAQPPASAALAQICHWIAPEDVPVRFDTRFYAVACERGVSPVPDGVEAERVWWSRPSDLLEASRTGGFNLYWPTMKVVEGIAGAGSVEEILAARIPPEEPEGNVVG